MAQLEADLRRLGKSGEGSLRRIQQAGKPASEGLRATDRAARDLKTGLHSISQEIPALQRLTRFLGPAAILGGMAAFSKSSLEVGKQFQAAMKRVEAATGAGIDDMGRLEDKARQMGATTAFTAMASADAIEVLAKNGLDVEAILGGALDATLAMAGALGGDLAPSADLATDIMQQFGLQAEELPRIADLIAGAALKSKFGFDDLRLAVGQAGGVAGQFGVNVEDFLAALSATASGFASGSDAGTSFKNFLARLVPQGKQAAEAMDQLGLEFFDAQGNMKSMAEIAGELQDGIAGLSDAARNDALQKIFGTDAVRTALLLADTGADGFRDLASAMGEVSAQGQAQVRLEGYAGALKELSAAWEALQLEASTNGGLDVAEETVDRLTAALRFLTDNFETVEEVVERVGQGIATYFVLRGVNLAIARGVVMRREYLRVAASLRGVGAAATGTTGRLAGMAVAGRSALAIFGGPVSLGITAASILALGVDVDKTADRIESAEAAMDQSSQSLETYRAATERAAKEQDGLGQSISEATRKMLAQSRAGMQDSIRELTQKRDELVGDLAGGILPRSSELDNTILSLTQAIQGRQRSPGIDNRYLDETFQVLQKYRDGAASIQEVVEAYDRVLSVGDEVSSMLDRLDRARQEGKGIAGSEQAILSYAKSVGIFGEELGALEGLDPGTSAWNTAFDGLAAAMREAQRAAAVLVDKTDKDFLGLANAASDTEKQIQILQAALEGNWDLVQELSDIENPFQAVEDGASDAADAVDRLTEAGKRNQKSIDAYAGYVKSRMSAPPDARASGMGAAKELIRRNEGGFVSTPYWDVNHWRAGYGSDTFTPAEGPAKSVSEGVPVSFEDAERDLQRRITSYFETIIGQIGETAFAALSSDQKASLASLLHNYGEGEFRQGGDLSGVLGALQTGQSQYVADQIAALGSHNGGQNRKRREEEAAAFGDVSAISERTDALEKEAEAIAKMVATGDEQLAQLQLEAMLLGKTAAEQAKLTFLHERLTEAKRAGIDVDTTMTADGERLIDVYKRQAEAIGQRTAAQQEGQAANDADLAKVEESTAAVRNAFDNLRPGGEGFSGFVDDMANHISEKLWDLAWDPVWDTLGSLLAGLTGGTGFSFANIFKAVGGSIPGKAAGGDIPGLANGGTPNSAGLAAGMIPGTGHGRQDNILLWGSVGEFMQPKMAVDYYGRDFMEAIRQRRFPRLADGGLTWPASGGGSGSSAPAAGGVGGSLEFSQRLTVDDGKISAYIERISGQISGRMINENNIRLAEQQRRGG
ncbi:MAG: phage tail tape measure protein [Rhodobacteraceae bacterium]|nr:phage tail tape measure protein [Paracoccaceae bacterium]